MIPDDAGDKHDDDDDDYHHYSQLACNKATTRQLSEQTKFTRQAQS